MKKYIVLLKVDKYIYKSDEYNDESMLTLAIFLNDGIGYKPFLDFLKDNKRITIAGNISFLEKQNEMISIEIDEYVYPNIPQFVTTIENLIIILNEFRRLEDLEADRIEIDIDHNNVSIKGDWIP